MRAFYQWTIFSSLTILIVVFSSCQSIHFHSPVPKKAEPVGLNSPFSPALQLTFIGDNEAPTLSPSGESLYFVSYNRKRHRNRQIYSLELSSRTHKRVTYHDGDNFSVTVAPSGSKIYYSSTTDEIKENSTYIRNALNKIMPGSTDLKSKILRTLALQNTQPTEIYQSQTSGGRIRRLTYSPQFDGQVTINPISGAILFSSNRTGHPQLFRFGKKLKRVSIVSKHKLHQTFPQYSPNGKELAWVQFNPKTEISKIILATGLGKKPRAILQLKGIQQSLTWTPDGEFLVYSSNRAQSDNFEIYAVHKSGTCLKRITYNLANDNSPVFSPDGKIIFFSSSRSGLKQIYQREFTLPESCINISI